MSSSRLSRSLAVMLVALVVVSAWAILQSLDRRAARLQQLSSATLIYTNKHLEAREFAKHLKAIPGLTCLAVEEKANSSRIANLVGSSEVSVPLLVVGAEGRREYYSGAFSIDQALEPLLSSNSRRDAGTKAIFLTVLVVAAAIILSPLLIAFTAFLQLVALGALIALVAGCLSCQVGTSWYAAVAPTIATVYVIIGGVLFSVCREAPRWALASFAATSLLFLLSQPVALVYDPKLCVGCLTMSFVVTGYYVACTGRLTGTRVSEVAFPNWFRPVVAAGAGLILTRNLLAHAGFLGAQLPPLEKLPDFVGRRVSEFVAGREYPEHVYLVSLDGCRECDQARRSLEANQIAYREIGLCTPRLTSPCFRIAEGATPTPIVLVSDPRSGRIVYQRIGWVSPGYEDALVREIRGSLSRRGM